METNSRRLGLIAQDLSSNLPTVFAIICGDFLDDGCSVEVNPDGTNNEDPVESRTLQTVDYSRLAAVLWGVCRSLDARVKALELMQ